MIAADARPGNSPRVSPPMDSPADLAGAWSGHYLIWGLRRPITAAFAQRGDRLIGTMVDLEPVLEVPFALLVDQMGLPTDTEHKTAERLRKLGHRDLGASPGDPADGPVRFESRLPPDSVLVGNVRGTAVSFRKTYKGSATSVLRVGARRHSTIRYDHRVDYRGEISPDGRQVEGTWRIYRGWSERLQLRDEAGAFFLRRDGW